MAAEYITLEEVFSCPVCFEIISNPVVLSCSHNVCKACLLEFWVKHKDKGCPVCRRSSKCESSSNLVVKKLCEFELEECRQSSSAASEQLCSLHNEQLSLFCQEDKQLVCVVCQSSEHNSHNCCPVPGAADAFKGELETALKALQERLNSFMQVRQTYYKTTEHIKHQAQKTVKQIKEEFQKLYQFLKEEQTARIAALREEERKKSQIMKKKIEEINNVICSLSDNIRCIEQNLKAEEHLFLQNLNFSLERTHCTLEDPQMDSGSLIDVAKHLGNLKFKVWEKMKDTVQYTPVILDPNTAHPDLTLSDDLTSVMFTTYTDHGYESNNTCKDNGGVRDVDEGQEIQRVPDNPERFDKCACVLGSEGFNSGSHCWDVEVGDSFLWEVGITTESNQRKGGSFYNAVWSVESNYEFYTHCPAQPKSPFSAEGGLQRLRVQLDWDRGEISFIDLLNDTCIITFYHTFTEKVYPFFWSRRINSPVKILPMTTTLFLEHTS